MAKVYPYQPFPFQGFPKLTQSGIFGLKKYHLTTLDCEKASNFFGQSLGSFPFADLLPSKSRTKGWSHSSFCHSKKLGAPNNFAFLFIGCRKKVLQKTQIFGGAEGKLIFVQTTPATRGLSYDFEIYNYLQRLRCMYIVG
jgi:hypothetical protein